MAATARKFEVEPQMPERTVIEEKVDRLREDVTDLKADVRHLDGKIDAISASLSEHRLETEKSFGKLRDEMKDSIATLRTETNNSIATLRTEMKDSIATLRTETNDSIATLRTEMKDSIAAIHSKLNAHLAWTIGTVIAATSALFTAARFFAAP